MGYLLSSCMSHFGHDNSTVETTGTNKVLCTLLVVYASLPDPLCVASITLSVVWWNTCQRHQQYAVDYVQWRAMAHRLFTAVVSSEDIHNVVPKEEKKHFCATKSDLIWSRCALLQRVPSRSMGMSLLDELQRARMQSFSASQLRKRAYGGTE